MRINSYAIALFAAISCIGAPTSAAPLDVFARAPGVKALTFSATQDLFNEVIGVVRPLAGRLATTVSIPDQNRQENAPVIGSIEVSAKNNKIDSMTFEKLDIPLGDRAVGVNTAVGIQVSSDVSAVTSFGNFNIGKITVSVGANIDGSVSIKNNGAGALSAQVLSMNAVITRFDFTVPENIEGIPPGINVGNVAEYVNRLYNEQIRTVISQAATQPLTSAVTEALNKALSTPPATEQDIDGIRFSFRADFIDDPIVTRDALTASVSVTANVALP
ncbi:hypothetical protein HK102_005211 [Quaeritorhiza haematococci]|nr:hypothetical protein HK102_005211 [Quaeritorhiza haematococci]